MRYAVRSLVVLLALSLAACAAKQDTGSTPGSTTQAAATSSTGIRVNNDGAAFRDIVVFLIPDNGVKQMLGEVKAGDTKTFQHPLTAGYYTFEQQRTDGTSRSERFYVSGGTKLVIWSLLSNNVQVSK